MASRKGSDRLIRRPRERAPAGRACARLVRLVLALAGSAWIVCLVGSAHAGAATPPRGSYAWSKFAHDAGNSGTSSDPGVSVADASSLGVRWMAPLGATALSSPVAGWNRRLGRMLVYIGTESGDFMALDAATGDTVWSVDLGARILSTPVVQDGSVWVSRASKPVLYKLNAATGAIRCSLPLAGSPDGSLTDATLARGAHVIYASTVDNGKTSGPVYAVKGSDCAVDWRFSAFNTPATGSWDPLSFATDGHGRALLLFGTSDPDDSVYALNAATGTKVWSFKTRSLADNSDTDVGAGVSISPPGRNGFADGVAYVPAEDGWLFALDLATGRLLWSYDFGAQLPLDHRSRSTPALVGRSLIFGEGGGVMAVDAVTGLPDWTFATGDVESISAPAVVGPAGQQVVAVTTLAGAFDVLSVVSGRLLYQYQTPSYSTSSFADVDGSLVTADADGFLYDLAPRGGNGAAPSTAVTSPRRGSTVGAPNGRLTIRGTASGTSISGVDVAIESGGPGGPWWDRQTGRWIPGFITNPATMTSPRAASTSWSLRLPVPAAGGSLRVLAGAVQSNGIADVSDLSPSAGTADATFSVDSTRRRPTVTVVGSRWLAPGTAVALSGRGFTRDETVAIKLDGASVASAVATGTGRLPRTAVPVPVSAAFGPAVVSATGTRSRRHAAATIEISNEWAQEGHDPTGDDYEPNDTVFLSHSSPGPPAYLAAAWNLELGATVRTSLSVWHGTGYIGDDAGALTALSIRTGEPAWTATEGAAIDSTPAVSGANVVFGTDGDSIVALDARTGAPAWTTRTTSPVRSAPAVSGGHIYVGSDDGTIYCLAASNGAVIWWSRLGGTVRGSPAVDLTAHTVIVGDASGAITALSATTGRTRWTFATGGVVTATPSISNGVVYVGSGDGVVYALSERGGALMWSTPVGAAVSAGGVLTPQRYVVGDEAGHLTTLARRSGAIVRVRPLGSAVVGLAGAEDWIAVTTAAGQVWGIKSSIIWKADVAPFAAAPTVVDGVVYTAATDGALDADTIPGTPIP